MIIGRLSRAKGSASSVLLFVRYNRTQVAAHLCRREMKRHGEIEKSAELEELAAQIPSVRLPLWESRTLAVPAAAQCAPKVMIIGRSAGPRRG